MPSNLNWDDYRSEAMTKVSPQMPMMQATGDRPPEEDRPDLMRAFSPPWHPAGKEFEMHQIHGGKTFKRGDLKNP